MTNRRNLRRHIGSQSREIRYLIPRRDLGKDFADESTADRRPSRQQKKENGSQTVNVCVQTDFAPSDIDLFRGHEGWRPRDAGHLALMLRISARCVIVPRCLQVGLSSLVADEFRVTETDDEIKIETPQLEAVFRKKGYVTGVKAASFLDKQAGFRDVGYCLDIVDWIMEPGSDEAYRNQLDKELIYQFGNPYHGKSPKRSIEGPQLCTQAKELSPRVIRGKDFLAVTMDFKYRTAAPGKKTGSVWQQTLVFPAGKRYFVSSDKITAMGCCAKNPRPSCAATLCVFREEIRQTFWKCFRKFPKSFPKHHEAERRIASWVVTRCGGGVGDGVISLVPGLLHQHGDLAVLVVDERQVEWVVEPKLQVECAQVAVEDVVEAVGDGGRIEDWRAVRT